MSWAFISALKENPKQSYVELLNSIRDVLETKYTQKPQLSCSHPLGMFIFFSGTSTCTKISANTILRRHRSPIRDVMTFSRLQRPAPQCSAHDVLEISSTQWNRDKFLWVNACLAWGNASNSLHKEIPRYKRISARCYEIHGQDDAGQAGRLSNSRSHINASS